MPMIDVYAPPNTFAEPGPLTQRLAATLMEIEGVPAIPMFRNNTAAFVHTPPVAMSNVAGESNYVRVQVLTNLGALDRGKQLAVVERFTQIVAEAAGDDSLKQRTWVLLTETYDGGWGLWGHAHTNDELTAAARAEIGRLQQEAPASARGDA
jgi:phenylpyruvate tautomerase PptA (4-oxalocrotonate tautomerase family)